jgi:hypothetical protein
VSGIANSQKKPEVRKTLGDEPLLFFARKKPLTEFAAYRPGILKGQTEDPESDISFPVGSIQSTQYRILFRKELASNCMAFGRTQIRRSPAVIKRLSPPIQESNFLLGGAPSAHVDSVSLSIVKQNHDSSYVNKC